MLISSVVDADLAAPLIPSVLPGGLLPVECLDTPVSVQLAVWPAARPGFTYQLLWDGNKFGQIKTINNEPPGEILTLEIDPSLLLEGVHEVAYRVTNPISEVSNNSLSTPIKIDRSAPGDPLLAPILFPVSVQDGLTAAELEAMGNVLPGQIAGYQDMQEGDVIRTYWGGVAGPVAVVGKDDMGLKRVMVDFSQAFLHGIGDIEAAVYYTVTDLAGNLSMDAQSTRVLLQLQTLPDLPLPVVREANGDNLDPVDAANGATVLVGVSAQLGLGDRVVVEWLGPKGSDSKEKRISAGEAGKELALVFSSALVAINVGEKVDILYSIYRNNGVEQRSPTLTLQVGEAPQDLVFDTSPVILDGKVYLIPLSAVLPAFPPNTTVQRAASGGQPPYRYSSSDEKIAVVDDTGLASVRGNGLAAITVTDAKGASRTYPLTVTGVIHCIGLGGGKHAQMSAAAANQGGRLPSKAELDHLHAVYGSRWPMGNAWYWSTTVLAQNLLGFKWYANKNLVTGGDFKVKDIDRALGVALR